MSENEPRKVPINELRQEEGAHELATSEDMEPYLRYIMATMQGADPGPQLEELSKLPLEKRYVWRVASALKWGFADFDDMGVIADRETISAGDLARVMDLLSLRLIQFCMFLKALVGAEEMKKLLVKAIFLAEES